ncbi:MAG: thiamine biosynthesis protein ThiS [Candidatus Methanofastidiosum sp.]|nr:thiamine biosynthesis protein ThiS [Methanofastidiosum sp.]NYT13578.1 MoaD/ThiS family protein [Candidatus Methanofastidiosa archaeon]
MIKVVFLRDKRTVEVEAKNVSEVFSKIAILREQYVVIKNGKIVCEDESLSDGDTIELFTVASGG